MPEIAAENPLDPSPEYLARVDALTEELWRADGSPSGGKDAYRERADELARMEAAGPTGLRAPADKKDIVEEAEIQENLGEFPAGPLGDEGRFRQTPMTREQAEHTPDAELPEGGTAA